MLSDQWSFRISFSSLLGNVHFFKMREILIRAKGRNKVGGLVVPHQACFFCFLIGCVLGVLPLEVQTASIFSPVRGTGFHHDFSRGEKHQSKRFTTITLPKTNIAPENRPLEKEIPIGNHHF